MPFNELENPISYLTSWTPYYYIDYSSNYKHDEFSVNGGGVITILNAVLINKVCRLRMFYIIISFKYTVEASHNNYFVFKLIHSMYTGKYLLSISFPLFPLYRTYLKRAKAGILFKIEFPIAINLASIYNG